MKLCPTHQQPMIDDLCDLCEQAYTRRSVSVRPGTCPSPQEGQASSTVLRHPPSVDRDNDEPAGSGRLGGEHA